jgi:hypothetical protein
LGWRDQLDAGQPTDSFARRPIEDALSRFGLSVYEELREEELRLYDGVCPRCAKPVTTGPDRLCYFCETTIEKPRIGADRPKSGRGKPAYKLSTVKRPRPGSKAMPITPPPPIEPGGNPEDALPIEVWPLPRAHGRGVPPRLTREQLAEAAWLYYYDGLGFVRIVRRLQLPFASERAGASVLHKAFERMHWPARDRIQATMLASYKHGLKARDTKNDPAYRRWFKSVNGKRQPRCAGRKLQPPEVGRRCKRPALEGSRYCWNHDPATAELGVAALEKGRALRDADMVPIDPFVWWLWGLHDRHKTWKAVAAAIDADRSMIDRCIHRKDNAGVAGAKTTISRALVRRKLTAAGDKLTFEQLYEIVDEPVELAA